MTANPKPQQTQTQGYPIAPCNETRGAKAASALPSPCR